MHAISGEVVAVLLLFIAALLLFAFIADESVLEHNYAFDTKVAALVAACSSPFLVKLMHRVTFFGSSQFLLPAYFVLAGYFLYKKNRDVAFKIMLIAVSSTAVMYLLKQLFKRHRPSMPVSEAVVGYGFPSGHSLSSFIFCSILSYLVWLSSIKKTWKYIAIVLLMLFSFTIGFSRIVLNVHYATDVIGGFCFGIIWILLCYYFLVKFKHKSLV